MSHQIGGYYLLFKTTKYREKYGSNAFNFYGRIWVILVPSLRHLRQLRRTAACSCMRPIDCFSSLSHWPSRCLTNHQATPVRTHNNYSRLGNILGKAVFPAYNFPASLLLPWPPWPLGNENTIAVVRRSTNSLNIHYRQVTYSTKVRM